MNYHNHLLRNAAPPATIVMLLSATIENLTKDDINSVFDGAVILTTAGWSLEFTLNGDVKTISSVSGSGSAWDFKISGDAQPFADEIKLRYTASMGASTDSFLTPLVDQLIDVTNNVLPVLYYDKAIPGESANQTTLQMDDQQAYALPNDWSFITWVKVPVTITNLEAMFGTLLTNPGGGALQNFHLWSLEQNSTDATYYDGFTRIYKALASSIAATPLLTGFSINKCNAFEQGQSRDKVMFAITAHLDVTWTVCSYMNGIRHICFSGLADIQAQMAFNWLSDRGVAARFGDSQIAGMRFYPNVEMTPAQMALEFNRGYGIAPQFTELFDVKAETPVLDTGNYYISDLSGNNNRVRLDSFATPASADVAFVNSVSAGDEILMTTILFSGNSIVNGQGSGSEPDDFPSKTMNLLGNYPFFGIKNGIGGIETPDMTTNIPTLDDIHYSEVYDKNILVFLEGGNHIVAGATPTQAFDAMKTYCQTLKDNAPNRLVIICTILPRDENLGGIPVGYDADRLSVNASILAEVSPPWDAIADIGGDATIGDLADSQDIAKYPDGIHPSDTTNDIIAGLVKNEISLL